jgi:hypothetical protein
MATNGYDRLKAVLESFIAGRMARVDFLALYPSKVVSQHADGSLDVVPDASNVPAHSRVPIAYGIPGCTATIDPGCKVLLGWGGGQPSKPYVALFQNSKVSGLELGGADSPVGRGDKIWIMLNAIKTALGTCQPGTGVPLLGPSAAYTEADIASSSVDVKA